MWTPYQSCQKANLTVERTHCLCTRYASILKKIGKLAQIEHTLLLFVFRVEVGSGENGSNWNIYDLSTPK